MASLAIAIGRGVSFTMTDVPLMVTSLRGRKKFRLGRLIEVFRPVETIG